MPIGQRMLASALGRSAVQVNKIIGQFQTQGLVTVGYDWMQLHAPERLQSLAGMTHSILQPPCPDACLSTRPLKQHLAPTIAVCEGPAL
jgi:hypothetical protein